MSNDATILGGFIIFFISVGWVLPFINQDLGYDAPAFFDISVDGDDFSLLDAVKVFGSIIAMFFWSFSVNIWVEVLIFLPLRLVAYFIFARNIWTGGGA